MLKLFFNTARALASVTLFYYRARPFTRQARITPDTFPSRACCRVAREDHSPAVGLNLSHSRRSILATIRTQDSQSCDLWQCPSRKARTISVGYLLVV